LLLPAFNKHTTQAYLVQNKYQNLMPFVADPTLHPISFSTVCVVPQGM